MPFFLDPTGHASYGVGLCARCSIKYHLDQLFDDPNYPGLKVCQKDMDQFDPYRLPPREPDQITLEFVRPDLPITGTPAVFANQVVPPSPPVAPVLSVDPEQPGWPPAFSVTIDGIVFVPGT
jgi:hypothetical protein